MKLSQAVKPISYLKSHTAEVLRTVAEKHEALVITQHGEAKAVIQGIVAYEQMQESLALLKLLALSSRSHEAGRSKPLKQAFMNVRRRTRME